MDKVNLLTKKVTQDNYPKTKFGEKQLRYHVKWETYYWLRYSFSDDSAYCAYCMTFGKKISNPIFKTVGYQYWKNAIGIKRGNYIKS